MKQVIPYWIALKLNPVRLTATLICVMLLSCCDRVPPPSPGKSRRIQDTLSHEPPLRSEHLPHLHDTTSISGNCILFLRPDEQRFDSYCDDPDSHIYEIDSDFGVGLANTLDGLTNNKRFGSIQGIVSTKRYILIRDCTECPLIIDRDSIDYGVIFSAKGQSIKTIYESIHSNYLQEAEAYFRTRQQ